MRRVRAGEIVSAAGGAALLVIMFLEWYALGLGSVTPLGDADLGANAWEAFGVIDLLLALVAVLGLALLAVQLVGRGPALPVAFEVVTSTLALVAVLLVAYRIVNQPGSNDLVDVSLGAWLGLVATAVVFWGAWKSLSDERPRPVDPPAPEPERRPTPA
jgi:hypothetical protein